MNAEVFDELPAQGMAFAPQSAPAAELDDAIPESPHSRTASPARRRGWRKALGASAAAVLAVLAGVGVTAWVHHSRNWVSTDNAFVSGHVHQVSARITGTLENVLVEENEFVRKGQVLARIDARDIEARRLQAEAQVKQAEAEVNTCAAQRLLAAAQIEKEESLAARAAKDFQRARQLYEGHSGAISRQEYDNATAAHDSAKASVKVAQSSLEAAEARVAAARSHLAAAEAALKEVELQLGYVEITAPADGRVGRKNAEPGNRVQPGQPLFALVRPNPWVTANLKETQLAHVAPGQSVRITLDAFPTTEFAGRVESVSPASGAVFSLLPPDNATGNFTKIVQRVPVKIVFHPQSVAGWEDRLAPGMSARVRIRVGP